LRSTEARFSEERLWGYGQRKRETNGQILILTDQMAKGKWINTGTQLEAKGAFWTAFRSSETKDMEVSHTASGLLYCNGQLPTVPTQNRALKRRLVATYADCVLIPTAVNQLLDVFFDESIAKFALEQCATAVVEGFKPSDVYAAFGDAISGHMKSVLSRSDRDLLGVLAAKALAHGDAQYVRNMIEVYGEGIIIGPPKQALGNFEEQVRVEVASSEKGAAVSHILS
jgi:hypothetical protein